MGCPSQTILCPAHAPGPKPHALRSPQAPSPKPLGRPLLTHAPCPTPQAPCPMPHAPTKSESDRAPSLDPDPHDPDCCVASPPGARSLPTPPQGASVLKD